MTLAEKFEALHPDLIQSFLKTLRSDAIPQDVQDYILILDKIPELQRRYPSVTRCAKEIQKLYPNLNLAFHTAREYIYTAINYFHLNSTVRNEAWDQYFADKAEELHNICVEAGNMKQAAVFLNMAHEWRLNKKGNDIDVTKIRKNIIVMRPDATAQIMGLDKEVNLKTIWLEKKDQYVKAVALINKLDINSDDKKALIKEAGLNLNINEADIIEDEQ